MKKLLLLICCAAVLVSAQEITVNFGETVTIKDSVFENYSGDFVIKNNGVLILENCTFKNNVLGSKSNEAIFSNGKVIAPVVNLGKITVSNCKFINNFSWNTALTNDFKAQAAAGAIVNFGELELAENNVFEKNSYQNGHFVVIRNDYIEQFAYIGSDMIFNAGDVEFLETDKENNLPSYQQNETALQVEVALLKNPVKYKAEILVKTNKPTNVKVTIFNALGTVMFSSQRQIQSSEIVVWNLTDPSGKKVPSGAYLAKVEADNFTETFQIGVQR
jgi:hypothetical protein